MLIGGLGNDIVVDDDGIDTASYSDAAGTSRRISRPESARATAAWTIT
jgi:hypothetical protein